MIILIGSRGFIGSSIYNYSISRGLEIKSIERSEFDYFNPAKLKNLLLSLKTSYLINAAGFTGTPNVDACESAKYECLLGNVVFPGIIREV